MNKSTKQHKQLDAEDLIYFLENCGAQYTCIKDQSDSKTVRITTNLTINQIQTLHSMCTIDAHPKYQRNLKIKNESKERIILSLLSGASIPTIYYSTTDDSEKDLEIIDGKQRICGTILPFLNNEFILRSENSDPYYKSGSIVQPYVNVRFEDLDMRDKCRLRNTLVNVDFFVGLNQKQRTLIFNNMNTGSTKLTEAEQFRAQFSDSARYVDAMYQENAKLEEYVKKEKSIIILARILSFINLMTKNESGEYINIDELSFGKYADVIRNFIKNKRSDFYESIDDEEKNKDYDEDGHLKNEIINSDMERFEIALKLVTENFLPKEVWETGVIFSNLDKNSKISNEGLAFTLIVAFAKYVRKKRGKWCSLFPTGEKLENGKTIAQQISDEIINVIATDKDFVNAMHNTTQSLQNTKLRFKKIFEILDYYMNQFLSLTKKKKTYFNKEQIQYAKEKQNNICPICNLPLSNQIEGDHVYPQDLNGKTTQKNCQAVHPQCNRRKSNKLPSECNPKIHIQPRKKRTS